MSYHRAQDFRKFSGLGLGLIVSLVFLLMAAPDASALGSRSERIARLQLDTARDGLHQSGPWTYEYTISQKGTRSEGYHGKLSFNGREVPEPANLNDFYETPWGRMYWVGRPVVMFGAHGWMPKPLASGPKGQALMDPAKLAGRVFSVRVKVLASEELGTPDRIETDPKVLAALKSFDLKEAHVQRNWFGLAQTWVSLHDTKRWGHFEMRVADPDPNRPLALEFRNTGGFNITTSSQMTSLAAVLTPPDRLGGSEFIELPPQVGAVRAVKCTLNPIIGDALDLFLVCRVEGSRRKP